MKIQKNVSLFDKNWFQTGGVARFYVEPTTEEEFVVAVAFATREMLPIFVLGSGANILISDGGFDGLVVRPMLKNILVDHERALVTAGAGVVIQDLINTSLDKGLSGLEELSGIPGTVGGSVYMNIHYFNFLLSMFLIKARVLVFDFGTVIDVDNAWFGFGYDQSILQNGKHFLVSATFSLKSADNLAVAYAKGRRDEIIRHRNNRYPRSNTCGSFFRNFHESEIPFLIKGKKVPYVAYYLDKIGVKGDLAVGNAIVSYQHANMLVTMPGATSADVVGLAKKIQELVYEKFGIIPKAECQLIGFNQYPLL